MKKIIKLSLFVQMMTTAILSYSQNKYWLETEIGINNIVLLDKSLSIHKYDGFGVKYCTGIVKESRNKIKVSHLNYSGISLQNNFGLSQYSRTLTLKSLTYYKFNSFSKDILWGWSNVNDFNYISNKNLVNFSERYYYSTTFGLSGAYNGRLNILNYIFDFKIPANLQIIGFYISPSYISSIPVGFLRPDNSFLKAFTESLKIFIPGRNWNFEIKPSIVFVSKRNNRIEISYELGYLRIEQLQKIKSSINIAVITSL